jgi:hypothetical protein
VIPGDIRARLARVAVAPLATLAVACSLLEAGIIDRSTSEPATADTDRDAGAEAHADGARACDMPEGGLPCDPGFVACGSGPSCATPSVCCRGGAGSQAAICQSASDSCENGAAQACDEAADCPAGEKCWGLVAGGVSMSTSCSVAPPSSQSTGFPAFQLCRTTLECVDKACVPHSCSNGFFETCGPLGAPLCL